MSKKAKLTSFRYAKEFAIATLEGGISVVLGAASAFPMKDLLHMKGLIMEYEENGSYTDKNGQNVPKYRMIGVECVDGSAL